MKKILLAAVQALALLTASSVFASDNQNPSDGTAADKDQIRIYNEVIVTSTRLEMPLKEANSSITVVTSDEIEKMQKTTVFEILRTIPGLDIVQAGSPGSPTSVFIRGAKSEHTLVLIDGIEMNDPMATGRYFDFANLTSDNIERVEVMRGPQSTLYGSDAIGGVINIITKSGEGRTTGFASLGGGSFNTAEERAGASGGNKLFRYSLGFSHENSDGISAAGAKYGNMERDGYENTSISGRLGITPARYFDLDSTIRYVNAKADLDNRAGVGGDDPNYTTETKQVFFRTQGRLMLFDNIWEQKLGFTAAKHIRDSRNDTDSAHPNDSSWYNFDSQQLKVDWQNNLRIKKRHAITFGIETEVEKGDSVTYSKSAYGSYTSSFPSRSARSTGLYIQGQMEPIDSWITTVGLRGDNHSTFGMEGTYHIASSFVFKQTATKIKGSYGTGFKAPSLYQLYSDYGDKNLSPETSTGWELGLEQFLKGERLSLGATYFNNEFGNMIDFDLWAMKYNNVSQAKAKGVEMFGSMQLKDGLDLRASYTYTSSKDQTTGRQLVRRPKNKVGFDLSSRLLKGNATFGLVFTGERPDNDSSTYPAIPVTLDLYTLVRCAISYPIAEHLQLFVRVENLLNQKYEEAKGYGTAGASAFGGLKVLF